MNMEINRQNVMRGLNVLWLVLAAVGLGIWLVGMPPYLDDWWYMEPLRGWYEAQGMNNPLSGRYAAGAGVPWEEITACWAERYCDTNGRFGNMLLIPLLMLPKWVGSVVAWLAILFSFGAVLRLSGVSLRRILPVPLALVLWMFMLPWRDHLGSLTFQMCYLLPPGFVMATALCVLRGGKGVGMCLLSFMSAFMAGVSHEGIAGPALCGLLALPILYRDCRCGRIYAALAGMLLGLIVLACSPGMWGRVAQSGGQERFTAAWLAAVGLICLPYVVAAVVWLVMAARGKGRELLADRFLTFMMVGGLMSCLVVCVSDTTPRAGWWACFAAVASLLVMIRMCAGRERNRYVAAKVALSAVCLAAVFAHLVSVDIMTLRLRRTFYAGLDDWLSRGRSVPAVFGEVTPPGERPLMAFMLPDDVFFVRGLYTVGMYYGYDPETRRERKVDFAIVPEQLRRAVDCGANDRTACSRDGWFYVSADSVSAPDSEGCVPVLVDYGGGYVARRAFAIPFVSEADGRRYYWLEPVAGWYVSRFRTVREIKLPE